MKPESVSVTRFSEALSTAQARAAKSVQACTRHPTPEAIHEARIAIRKLTTAVSLMPRKLRKDDNTVKEMKALQQFYAYCAKMRDIDAMLSALSNNVALGDLRDVVTGLKRRRTTLVSRIVNSGFEEIRLVFQRPTDDTRGRLSKRLNKLLGKRAGRANDLYWIAASGRRHVVELHKLRKECRHIKYLLDFANQDARIKSLKLDLEDARDKLGSIRDDDVLLDFLRYSKENASVARLVSAVSASRQVKYKKFFSGQTSRGRKPRLLEGILGLA
jgi:CHAD domain-containing protein